MYFKQILNERCGCASYVIASRKTLEAAVVDAACDTEPYSALLRERGFRLRFVIDTHIIRTMSPAPAAWPPHMGPSCACMSRRARPTRFTGRKDMHSDASSFRGSR